MIKDHLKGKDRRLGLILFIHDIFNNILIYDLYFLGVYQKKSEN